MREIILLKIESVEKCLKRIKEKLVTPEYSIENNDIQDIIVLNLQRACQQSIDLAMFLNAELGTGVPKSSSEAFEKLMEKGVISKDSYENMKKMVGFRNVAVHQYQSIDYNIVEYVIKNRLEDFYKLNREIIDSCL